MKLIADCGGSKTDWRGISKGEILQWKTEGFNPFHQDIAVFDTQIASFKSIMAVAHDITEINFYGAGLGQPEQQAQVKAVLQSHFSMAAIHVASDLLAAARSLCGYQPGIACILGTGANSCFYDGKEILANVAPLGYILGDEGSGTALGKRLLKAYCRGGMPEDIHSRFEKRFNLSQADILTKIYQSPNGHQFLAGFTKFLLHNIASPFIYSLVYEEFSIFFEKVLSFYKNTDKYQAHFTGGVAFYFSNILRQVAIDKGVSVGVIAETPIAGLTLFHQSETLTK